jgi:hypothetical protein
VYIFPHNVISEKIFLYAACVKEIKFDAKYSISQDIFLPFLHKPWKILFYHRTLHEHIECGDIRLISKFDKSKNSYFTKENIANKIANSGKKKININLNSMIWNPLKIIKEVGERIFLELSIPFLLALPIHSTDLMLPYAFSFKHCSQEQGLYVVESIIIKIIRPKNSIKLWENEASIEEK